MARIYEKGQVTIPKSVREAAGLHPGDRVVMEARSGEVVVRRARGVLEFEPPPSTGARRAWADARRAARENRAARIAAR